MTKEIIIIALIILVIYLYYQQNNQPIIKEENSEVIRQLQQEVKHYQNLYETRVAKDVEDSEKVKKLENELTEWEAENERVKQLLDNFLTKQRVKNFQELEDKLSDYWDNLQDLEEKAGYVERIDLEIKELMSEKKTNLLEMENTQQEQLRKINLLFDDQAQDYKVIDFNGLYSLLASIAEREREREQNSWIPSSWKWK